MRSRTSSAGPYCPTDYAADLRSRAAWQAGQFFEKLGEKELAGQLYRAGSSPQCNERLVRLLYGAGEKADAEDLLRRMIDDPASDGEFVFATDFYARKFGGRRTGSCTELLARRHHGSPSTTPIAAIRRRASPVCMRREGLPGVLRREHALARLFGLLFWDELFESGQLHSSFDWLPHCLKDRSFVRVFATQIDDEARCRRSRQCSSDLLLRTIAAKLGTSQRRLRLGSRRRRRSAAAAGREPTGKGRRTILRSMCEDFRDMRDGFPDLMLEKDGVSHSWRSRPKETLSAAINSRGCGSFGNAGIRAEIGRVDYRFDPEQDYVVVDIETTGSWASGDRITEIGAVKSSQPSGRRRMAFADKSAAVHSGKNNAAHRHHE